MATTAFPVPTDIRRVAKVGLEIVWTDGHRSEYSNHYLRRHCPCATCRERPPRALPVVGEGGHDLFPAQIGVVGRYALSIQWSDGHDTGIYSYRTLRQLCPCEQCRLPEANAPPSTAAAEPPSPAGSKASA